MRKLTIFALLMIVLSLSGLTAAQAQDTPTIPCGTLAEADCQLLQQSAQAMTTLQSASFDLNVDLNLENIPDTPSPLAFNLSGTGSFSGDMTALHNMQAMNNPSDPTAAMNALAEGLRGVNADLSLNINLPSALTEQGGGEIPSQIPLNVRLVDGIAYLDFDALRDVAGDNAESMPTGWQGIDLVGLIQGFASQAGTMDLGASPAGMSADLMAQFQDPEFIGKYLTITRTDSGGGQEATFTSTIDFAGLMSDPAVQDAMRQAMTQQADSGDSTMSEDDMNQAMDMMGQMFQGMTFTSTQTIGLDDHYVHSSDATFDWDLSGMMAAMQAADSSSGNSSTSDGPAPIVHFHSTVTLSDFNSAPEITAPEGATVIPLESLGMGDMSSRGSEDGSGASNSDAGSDAAATPMATAEASG
jgi:hypothetical protein